MGMSLSIFLSPVHYAQLEHGSVHDPLASNNFYIYFPALSVKKSLSLFMLLRTLGLEKLENYGASVYGHRWDPANSASKPAVTRTTIVEIRHLCSV